MIAVAAPEVEYAVGLPILVRGRLVEPPDLGSERLAALAAGERDERVHVLARPVVAGSGPAPADRVRLTVLARPGPRELLDPDPAGTVRELLALPYDSVLDYVAAVRAAVADDVGLAPLVALAGAGVGEQDPARWLPALTAGLLDPREIAAAVRRDLAWGDSDGRSLLEGWVEPAGPVHDGVTARLARRVGNARPGAAPVRLRAVPTRQLHITAGNSPVVPVASAVWALAVKGAAVVKAPRDAVVATALLASAMAAAAPDHPLTRHTSLVYWPGGQRAVEDVLLAPGRFDRCVAWGSATAARDIAARCGFPTIVFGPGLGVSLIGRDALADLPATAACAVVDSMIAGQAACNASLLHLVEGTPDTALAYAEELRTALADWDRALPPAFDPAGAGRLRRVRRGAFAHGVWLENGSPPYVTSSVVYLPAGFDPDHHPGGRCVVVRSVPSLRTALAELPPGVVAAGVAPEHERLALADDLVARGVHAVHPLGGGERGFAGMPHDGVRVLTQLVRWSAG